MPDLAVVLYAILLFVAAKLLMARPPPQESPPADAAPLDPGQADSERPGRPTERTPGSSDGPTSSPPAGHSPGRSAERASVPSIDLGTHKLGFALIVATFCWALSVLSGNRTSYARSDYGEAAVVQAGDEEPTRSQVEDEEGVPGGWGEQRQEVGARDQHMGATGLDLDGRPPSVTGQHSQGPAGETPNEDRPAEDEPEDPHAPGAQCTHLCVVCLDGKAAYAPPACGHMCMCGRCSEHIMNDTAQCPVCKQHMEA